MYLAVGLVFGFCARGRTSDAASCVESRTTGSIAGDCSTKPSVNCCNESGETSPPALTGVH